MLKRSQRVRISKNFFLDEYVTPSFYNKWGSKGIWWIRPELITIDQSIRDRFDVPMIINNWARGGGRTQSGLRYPEAEIGAGDSLHKFGCASDTKFSGVSEDFYDAVREDIQKNFIELYKPLGLTTIEADTKTWLHKDTRNIPYQKKINIIHP